MSLSREPSQRALNWVRWNSTRTRPKQDSSSNNNSKRTTEPEIVHLGGARVGTAFEALELTGSDRLRSRPADQPITQWAYNPPPNPPGIGIAIACPEDSPSEIHNAPDLDNDRPITQWFPELQPESMKSKNESQSQGLCTAYPYTNLSPNTAEELPSPLTPCSSDIATPNSPPRSVSPSRSPMSSISDAPETTPTQSVQFPKRSTSLSQKVSRYAPPRLTKRATNDAPLKITEVQLRRTQSSAEMTKQAERRISPPQPAFQEQSPSPQRPESTRTSPKPPLIPQDLQSLPPLTAPPPNGPLPPINGTKLAGHGRTRDQSHVRGRSTSSNRGLERSPLREPQEQSEAQSPGPESKLNPKERFWLHRHYRGEATFLRAWGLEITNDEEREEGRKIMRELIEGEAQEERELQERQRMHHRSGSQSRASTATTLSGRDAVSLDVIAEERLSREFHLLSTVENQSDKNGTEDKFWKTENEVREQRLRNYHRPDKHSRNESTDSVLGQYLDLRLSDNT
ncbi:hypothetical protein F4808DRAFT_411253 [Astrocystis sublimbata]|nr:hypothetical protein F4808DRAFT_411253 [Astrocystis sublimbata]